MAKYKVHFNCEDGSVFAKEVDGARVILFGFEEYEFFIHDVQDTSIFGHLKHIVWKTISEKETGARVGYGYTEQDAYKMAYDNLGSISKSEFERKINEARLIIKNNLVK